MKNAVVKGIKQYKGQIAFIVLITLFCELFIFNYRFFESKFYNHLNSDYKVGSGLEKQCDGTYLLTDESSAYIEYNDINDYVKNVFVSCNPNNGTTVQKISIFISDDSSSNYYELSETETISNIPKSQYIRLYCNGKAKSIKIKFDGSVGQRVSFESGLNQSVPYDVNLFRVFCVAMGAFIIAVLRSCSKVYTHKIDFSKKTHIILLLVCIILNAGIIIAGFDIFYNNIWQEDSWISNMQYNYMAESLAKGLTYIDIKPADILATLSNPYDPQIRNQALAQSGESCLIDAAYYNGRYYSYFGIVPELVFFLPHWLIFKTYLSNGWVNGICALVFIFASFTFIYGLIKKYFKDTSIGMYLVVTSIFIGGSQITYLVQYSYGIYAIPIVSALMFIILGLNFWIYAVNDSGDINKIFLLLGAISMGLVIGCRPQMAIAVFFAFFIFQEEIEKGLFFSRKGLLNTLLVILPFIVVVIGILSYNYVRFGDVLDFGAKYNLTSFDMTHRSFSCERLVLGLWCYFIQPLSVSLRFPYFYNNINYLSIISDFQGLVINEEFLCGFFAICPVSLILLFARREKKGMKDKKIYGFFLTSIIFALIIASVDTEMVGITLRYLTDFSVFMSLSVALISLEIFGSANTMDIKEKNPYAKNFQSLFKIFLLLCLLSLFIIYSSPVASNRVNCLQDNNADKFYFIKYELCSFLSIR